MGFQYSQATGEFTEDGQLLATGYSGNGDGMNNPAMQQVHGTGPIPQGSYTIEAPHADAEVGPVAMCLVPAAGNAMFNRGDFLIHGDNPALDHSASEGCIVLPHTARAAIGAKVLAGDDQLTVVE
jgi:hypothetical protein